jgi:hypothetical protein
MLSRCTGEEELSDCVVSDPDEGIEEDRQQGGVTSHLPVVVVIKAVAECDSRPSDPDEGKLDPEIEKDGKDTIAHPSDAWLRDIVRLIGVM